MTSAFTLDPVLAFFTSAFSVESSASSAVRFLPTMVIGSSSLSESAGGSGTFGFCGTVGT